MVNPFFRGRAICIFTILNIHEQTIPSSFLFQHVTVVKTGPKRFTLKVAHVGSHLNKPHPWAADYETFGGDEAAFASAIVSSNLCQLFDICLFHLFRILFPRLFRHPCWLHLVAGIASKEKNLIGLNFVIKYVTEDLVP